MTESAPDRSLLRPVLACDGQAQRGSVLAGGWLRFGEIAVEAAGAATEVLPAAAVAALHPEMAAALARLHRPRAPLGRLWLDRPMAVAALPEALEPGALAAAVAGAAASGAAAVDATVLSGPGGPEALAAASALLPVLASGLPASADFAAAAWRAPDWAALAAPALPPGCLRVTPRPVAGLADAAAVRAFHEAAARRLDVLDAAGADRAALVLDLGPAAPAALGSLSLLHGLGCVLMAGLDMGPAAAAAGAVVAAAQGVQLICSAETEAVAAGLALWQASREMQAARSPAPATTG